MSNLRQIAKSIKELQSKSLKNLKAIKGGDGIGGALTGAATGGASGAVNPNTGNNSPDLLDEAGDTSI